MAESHSSSCRSCRSLWQFGLWTRIQQPTKLKYRGSYLHRVICDVSTFLSSEKNRFASEVFSRSQISDKGDVSFCETREINWLALMQSSLKCFASTQNYDEHARNDGVSISFWVPEPQEWKLWAVYILHPSRFTQMHLLVRRRVNVFCLACC